MMIVRKLRLEKGLSQEQLAAMAGISTRTLQRIERGANASPETLKCIASVLETNFTSLRNDTMAAKPNSTAPALTPDEQAAMEYVRDIKAFYLHALAYVIVVITLAIVNVLTIPSYLWFLWTAFGWGIGIVAHGLGVFEFINLFGDKWEKQHIQKRLGRQPKGSYCCARSLSS